MHCTIDENPVAFDVGECELQCAAVTVKHQHIAGRLILREGLRNVAVRKKCAGCSHQCNQGAHFELAVRMPGYCFLEFLLTTNAIQK